MSRPATPVDFQRLFAAIPAAIMVLRPDAPHFTIAAASDALLREGIAARARIAARPGSTALAAATTGTPS